MGKRISGLLFTGFCIVPIVHAGTMGPAQIDSYRAFISAEGGYTWNKLTGIDISIVNIGQIVGVESNRGLSGRLAAGLIHPLTPSFSVSGEIGWGTYGRTTVTPIFTGLLVDSPVNITVKHFVNGFDVLGGVVYTQPHFNLFAKAGALIQNHETDLNVDVSLIGLNAQFQRNLTQALPEIKLGGSYIINNNWSIIGSYMHAFGSNTSAQAIINPLVPTSTISINRKNPSLDAVLAGVQLTI